MTDKPCSRCGRVEQLRRGLCHADYERDRRAGRIESLVSAQQTRNHLVWLRVNGWRYREIARAAGINRSQLARVFAGRQLINVKTANRICAIDPTTRSEYIRLAWDTRRENAARRAWDHSYEGLRASFEQRHPVVVPVPKPGEWTRAALCAQVDNEMFFPEKGGATRHAKRICLGCEVREKCLEFALDNEIRHGVFGGFSDRERLRLAAARRGRGKDGGA